MTPPERSKRNYFSWWILAALPFCSATAALLFLYATLPDPGALLQARQLSAADRELLLAQSPCSPEQFRQRAQFDWTAIFIPPAHNTCQLGRILGRQLFMSRRQQAPTWLEEALMAFKLEQELSEPALLNAYLALESQPFHQNPMHLAELSDNPVEDTPTDINRLIQETRLLVNSPSPATANTATQVDVAKPAITAPKKTPPSSSPRQFKKAGPCNYQRCPADGRPSRKQPLAKTPAIPKMDRSALYADNQPLPALAEEPTAPPDESASQKRLAKISGWMKKSWRKISRRTSAAYKALVQPDEGAAPVPVMEEN